MFDNDVIIDSKNIKGKKFQIHTAVASKMSSNKQLNDKMKKYLNPNDWWMLTSEEAKPTNDQVYKILDKAQLYLTPSEAELMWSESDADDETKRYYWNRYKRSHPYSFTCFICENSKCDHSCLEA